jgi:beta-lactamase class A
VGASIMGEAITKETDMSLSRRALLTAGAAAAAGGAVLLGPAAAHATGGPAGAGGRLRELERRYGAKLGVYARNLRTGRTVRHHADDLFPICSLFKTLAAAAVLRDLDRDGEFLARRIHYTEADLVDGSDETRKHLAEGMTVAELCDVTIRFSWAAPRRSPGSPAPSATRSPAWTAGRRS